MYDMFCYSCKKNICGDCEENHKGHKRLFFKEIKAKLNDIKKIKGMADETQNLIKEYKNELNRIKNVISNFLNLTEDNYISYSQLIDYAINNSNNIDYMNYH